MKPVGVTFKHSFKLNTLLHNRFNSTYYIKHLLVPGSHMSDPLFLAPLRQSEHDRITELLSNSAQCSGGHCSPGGTTGSSLYMNILSVIITEGEK